MKSPFAYLAFLFAILSQSAFGQSNFQTAIVDQGGETPTDITLLQDGHYLLTGHAALSGTGATTAYAIKTDANGSPIWRNFYDSYILTEPVRTNTSLGATACTDGGFALTGAFHFIANDLHNTGILIAKMDASGQVKWARNIAYTPDNAGGKGNAIAEAPNGDLLVAGELNGHFMVTRIDSLGAHLWTKLYSVNLLTSSGQARDILALSDGNFAVTGGMWAGGSELTVLKIDGNGNVIWEADAGRRRRAGIGLCAGGRRRRELVCRRGLPLRTGELRDGIADQPCWRGRLDR